MPKIEYKSIKFQQKSLELINLVNQVVEEYQAQHIFHVGVTLHSQKCGQQHSVSLVKITVITG